MLGHNNLSLNYTFIEVNSNIFKSLQNQKSNLTFTVPQGHISKSFKSTWETLKFIKDWKMIITSNIVHYLFVLYNSLSYENMYIEFQIFQIILYIFIYNLHICHFQWNLKNRWALGIQSIYYMLRPIVQSVD